MEKACALLVVINSTRIKCEIYTSLLAVSAAAAAAAVFLSSSSWSSSLMLSSKAFGQKSPSKYGNSLAVFNPSSLACLRMSYKSNDNTKQEKIWQSILETCLQRPARRFPSGHSADNVRPEW